MKYYIYKIENIVNHKKYIGLTNNIARRRSRHFTDLRCKRHDNGFLQKEYNIYTQEAFTLETIYEGDCTPEEIGEKEKYYIKLYDSYRNGYNQNEGGNFGPANGGSHLTHSDIMNICAALEFCNRPGGALSKMFDVSLTTISRIKHKVNHLEAIEAYEALPLSERKELYNIFKDSFDFEVLKNETSKLASKRILSQEQVFLVLANQEFKVVPIKRLIQAFGVASNTIYSILKVETYHDYRYQYNLLSQDKKESLVTLLRNQYTKTH